MNRKNLDDQTLVLTAAKARAQAYVPYSHFHVGAALLDGDGRLYTGCNVENASYGATCCAERTAVFKAISEGSKQISRIAVVGDQAEPCLPCGICRQVLAEFATPDFELLAGTPAGHFERYGLDDLLPHAFHLEPSDAPIESR
jgi:cytidine deaminase